MGKSASVTTARDGYTVPLSQLIRSDANVRATHTQSRIDELAASIAAHQADPTACGCRADEERRGDRDL